MSFAVGEVAGEYRVLGQIGEGGMGAVYKVQHAISQRVEAMKVLLPDLNGSMGLEERFLREIQVQASLNHPNIASLHTAFRFQNQLLMVMEYVEGRSLRDAMQAGLALETGVRHMREVLGALAYSHARGVVHRDIKPGNILIAADGRVKLVDFGIASVTADTRVTGQGVVMGSLAYMSPEQARGDKVDARSDLYSVGATLYEIATGALPIEGENDFAIILGHQTRVPVTPALRTPGVPAEVSRAVMKALEKQPERRFQTAEEFARALQLGSEIGNGTGNETGQTWDAGIIELATRELAAAIGPIARVIVKREMKSAGNWKELRRRLAEEIPAGKERERFLGIVR